MIQLNLLPDVKLEYLKAQRLRRQMFTISFLVTAFALVLLIVLLGASSLQKKHLSDLNKDITTESNQLKNKPDIDKILTVQNQLNSLTALHAGKPAASRLTTYLNDTTPTQVSISQFSIDFTTQGVTITGTAENLSSVNKYVDSLKYTTYSVDGGDSTKAFSDVVLSSFSLNSANGSTSNGQQANYSITLLYDPVIFDITQNVDLSVPTTTTTRATGVSGSDLFQQSSGAKGN
jgi:hypothetical protein